MDALGGFLGHLIGQHGEVRSLTVAQVCVRAVVIYLSTIVLLRVGEHRFLGKNTALDIVVGFILGSTLSRAVNGTAPFLGTLAAATVLLLLHWLLSTLAYYSDGANVLLAGKAIPLIEKGRVLEDRMRRNRINQRLLLETLRLKGHLDDPALVETACYERNGDISVIPRREVVAAGVRVVDIAVAEGVQTVRLEIAGPSSSPPP